MNKIINLTQHNATIDQMEAGVLDLPAEERVQLTELLTFEEVPSWQEIESRAACISALAIRLDAKAAMIGGAPFLMGPLEKALVVNGIRPLYAFSKRESIEEVQSDGSVKKTNVFRHTGFVRPYD